MRQNFIEVENVSKTATIMEKKLPFSETMAKMANICQNQNLGRVDELGKRYAFRKLGRRGDNTAEMLKKKLRPSEIKLNERGKRAPKHFRKLRGRAAVRGLGRLGDNIISRGRLDDRGKEKKKSEAAENGWHCGIRLFK